MITTEDICTLPRSLQGQAWLLSQKFPNASLPQIRRLARGSVIWQDAEHRLTDCNVRHVARDVLQMPAEATESTLVATRPITAVVIAELGETLAMYLADGHTQSEAARKLDIAQSGVAKRILRCKNLNFQGIA